jgi:hypothetical protein
VILLVSPSPDLSPEVKGDKPSPLFFLGDLINICFDELNPDPDKEL